MSAQEWRRRFEALSERDQKIYKLASSACNSMGFACQMAAQGADNSQCKYEEKAEVSMRELFELLATAPGESSIPQRGGQHDS
jgi:hypothetical protein